MATMAMTGAAVVGGCAAKSVALQSQKTTSSFWGEKARSVKASATTRWVEFWVKVGVCFGCRLWRLDDEL